MNQDGALPKVTQSAQAAQQRANRILKTRDEVLETILSLRGKNGNRRSWDSVAGELGVSKPCIWRLVNEDDYYPGPTNSAILGMQYTKPVPVCPIHGEVHQYDCTSEIIRPRRKVRKRKRERIAISKVDPESAARTIRRNLPPDVASKIKELL